MKGFMGVLGFTFMNNVGKESIIIIKRNAFKKHDKIRILLRVVRVCVCVCGKILNDEIWMTRKRKRYKYVILFV